MICKNSIRLKLSYIILILSILVPTLIFHGSIDDFLFQHAGIMQESDNAGKISEIEPILSNTYSGLSGFYATGIILSKICNIPYDILFFLPIYLTSFVFLFFSLLSNISPDKILCSLIIFIITTFSSNISFLNFHPHGMGFSLLLILSLLLLVMHRSDKLHSPSSVVIILVLIAINYVSYKADAWALIFLVNFIFFNLFNRYFLNSGVKKSSMLNLFLIGFIVAFSFNKFLYNRFILSLKSEYNLGIDVLLTLFAKNPDDLLSYYNLYYISPAILKYLLLIRPFLILVFVSILTVKIFQSRILNRVPLDVDELLFISLVFMGVANLLIYNSLGFFDIKVLVYTGILAFPILQRNYKMKKLVNFFIILLVIINLSYLSVANYYNDAQKDDNFFEYIGPVDKWYTSYQNDDFELKTDVLTKGYIIKEMTKRGESKYPTHFDINDMLVITGNSSLVPAHAGYVVNYKLKHFSITNWRILKSFSNFRYEIESNKHLNKIYSSSEYIFVYMPKE